MQHVGVSTLAIHFLLWLRMWSLELSMQQVCGFTCWRASVASARHFSEGFTVSGLFRFGSVHTCSLLVSLLRTLRALREAQWLPHCVFFQFLAWDAGWL